MNPVVRLSWQEWVTLLLEKVAADPVLDTGMLLETPHTAGAQ